MDDIDEAMVDTVADEMRADVDVLHSGMCLWVVGAGHGALIVAEQGRGVVLGKAQFVE
jgi:hypothetical protein